MRPLPLLTACAVATVAAGLAGAAEMKAELDAAADPHLLDTRFGRYGPVTLKAITREGPALHFRLPATAKTAEQVGLYSYFAIAGDFEITATFEVLSLPPPKSGYGACFGFE